MIVYRDMTFCCNEQCNKKCNKYVTPDVEKAAKYRGLPLAVANFLCIDCGDDTDEKMS